MYEDTLSPRGLVPLGPLGPNDTCEKRVGGRKYPPMIVAPSLGSSLPVLAFYVDPTIAGVGAHRCCGMRRRSSYALSLS